MMEEMVRFISTNFNFVFSLSTYLVQFVDKLFWVDILTRDNLRAVIADLFRGTQHIG